MLLVQAAAGYLSHPRPLFSHVSRGSKFHPSVACRAVVRFMRQKEIFGGDEGIRILVALTVYLEKKHAFRASTVCSISSSTSSQKQSQLQTSNTTANNIAFNHFLGMSIALVVTPMLCGVTSRENRGVGADAFLPKLL